MSCGACVPPLHMVVFFHQFAFDVSTGVMVLRKPIRKVVKVLARSRFQLIRDLQHLDRDGWAAGRKGANESFNVGILVAERNFLVHLRCVGPHPHVDQVPHVMIRVVVRRWFEIAIVLPVSVGLVLRTNIVLVGLPEIIVGCVRVAVVPLP